MKRVALIILILVFVFPSCGKKKTKNPISPFGYGLITGKVTYMTCGGMGWVEAPYEDAMVIPTINGVYGDTARSNTKGEFQLKLRLGIYDLVIKSANTFPDSSTINLLVGPRTHITLNKILLNHTFMAGEILLKFPLDLSEQEAREIVQAYGCTLVDFDKNIHCALITIPENTIVSDMLPLFENHPQIIFAEPNGLECAGVSQKIE